MDLELTISGIRSRNRGMEVIGSLALVLMTMALVEIDNEHIFSLKLDIIGSHATRTSTGLLHARARIEVYADPK
jgi:hypothetical protein